MTTKVETVTVASPPQESETFVAWLYARLAELKEKEPELLAQHPAHK